MKGNGIKRLIELLNESEDGFVSHFVSYDDLNGVFRLNNGQDFHYALILSKEYGFIRRLVDNNKIDIERLHKIVDYRLEIKENYVNAHDYNSDCLLMLLSISDTPIEDLILYLK